MGGGSMNELETRIAYAAHRWVEALSDVECYLPPDDSESLGDNYIDIITYENKCEKEFLQLLNELKEQAK